MFARVVHLDEKGRGRALSAALMPLAAPLLSGHSHIAIGSRLARSSRVVRGPKREFISRSYNLILRGTLRAHFSDAQCGCKAMRTDVVRTLLPLVEDTGWFFDTASGYQLATGDPVMPLGGFNGGSSGATAEISAWVQENFAPMTSTA